MAVFKNRLFTKRDYECMNIVACEAVQKPVTANDRWEPAQPSDLKGLDFLYAETQGGVTVRYYGYL